MPTTNIFRGGAEAIAQVVTVVPANVEIGDIFELEVEDELGNTASVSFTATAATVANVTAGLVAAWNASLDPLINGVTAADDTTELTLTADVAGRPFSVTTSTTNGGAANTQTLTATVTTASSGPNDYGAAANWTQQHVPQAGEDVIIAAGAGSIYWSLNQSAVAIASFKQEKGHGGSIGRFGPKNDLLTVAPLYYLQIDCTSLELCGNGSLCAIDVGASAITPVIDHEGTPASSGPGQQCVYLKGSALASPEIRQGTVGLATYPGDTATITTEILASGGTVYIGSGCTVSGVTAIVQDATVYCAVTMPAAIVRDGAYWYQTAGVWTQIDVYEGGQAFPDAGGTYATTILHAGGTVTKRNLVASTFTNTTRYARTEIDDPAARIEFTNTPTYPDGQVAAHSATPLSFS